ncbi:DUF4962 domain-containing protein [Chitinophaga qingshengii]|uniref:DUF4962 domain-containing protein n=1 Tax=Chitinophaga qingshengii TaxID=1569794 RepID=A0ABR7TRW4_9BACT|nr:DUF4962 domain-containing protein [Chitinophaga qingshengii]MBC9933218.1 DUF4962 domain-containing protein [Chitinophaga qingshengii]
MHLTYRWPACMAVMLSLSATAQQLPDANQYIQASSLHTRERSWPFPANGATDPPALLWPGVAGKNVQYLVRYSQDSLFSPGRTQQSDTLPWAMYAIHAPLQKGTWYWQYASRAQKKDAWSWSERRYFYIAEPTVTPTLPQMMEKAHQQHPRLWDMQAQLSVFRQRNRRDPEAVALLHAADKLINAALPEEKPTRPRDTTGMTARQQEKMMEFMYHGFGEKVAQPIRQLCIAYWLSGENKYATEAVRRAMQLTRLDPSGYGSRDDFNNGNVMEGMAWAYDMACQQLTAAQRDTLQQAILRRGTGIYRNLVNRFELQLCDNHVWQHILRNFSITAMALAHDVPQTNGWLQYAYEVWSARFPVLGSTDGGWHEGNGYFRVHFVSLAYLSLLFSNLSGVDYFATPWMQNLPYYLLYSYPPSSASTALGDMHENLSTTARTPAVFAEALSRKVHNPYFNWYVHTIQQQFPDYFRRDKDFVLFRLLTPAREGNNISSPAALPASRTFPDVGLTMMHSHLEDTRKDLMASLSANPFGSSGHGHASQNAFTINYSGKLVFGGSGFYSNFSDAHNLLHYRSSRAYCTVLADSLGQRIGENGYGWMPRHIAGKRIQYTLGDASNAYGPVTAPFWLGHFNQNNLQPDRQNGFGDAGVTLYRRHMLMLDSNIIVLYDELAARQPVKWTWQAHSPFAIQQGDGNTFTINEPGIKAGVHVYAHTKTVPVVHQRFNSPALNWKGKTDDDGNIVPFTEQWHCGVTTIPQQQARLLTVMQVGISAAQPVIQQGQEWRVGPWHIIAELDENNAPLLYIFSDDQTTALHYGSGPFRQGKHQYQQSTVLTENGQSTEAIDILPSIIKTR